MSRDPAFYGLTESGNTAVCLPPTEHVVGGPRMRAAGRPYPGFAIEIRDDAGKRRPAREIGEVWIHTPARMVEYWGLPDATAQTLVDGWVRTGDAGYLDEDGFLFICDRIKDAIIVAGENVYPAEIENVLAEHHAVVEAAVVGIPDEQWGEAVHAFVYLARGPGSADVTWCCSSEGGSPISRFRPATPTSTSFRATPAARSCGASCGMASGGARRAMSTEPAR